MKQFIALIVGIAVLCFVVAFLMVGFVVGSYNTEVWKEPGRVLFLFIGFVASAFSIISPAVYAKDIINYFEKGEKK